MPSSRELAVLYKVNQNTAARIYREMESEGYCLYETGHRDIRLGGGKYV